MSDNLHDGLKALGNSAVNKKLYEQETVNKNLLERFPSPFAVTNPSAATGSVTITAPEFTSLCPLTGQPDFATIVVDYTPDQWCVESKSFKLYMGSFRNQGEFHESCVNRIVNDLVELLDLISIKVHGLFTPRGGIAFQPVAIWDKVKR
jgi:7-cyano-7-deazaguanine reductase